MRKFSVSDLSPPKFHAMSRVRWGAGMLCALALAASNAHAGNSNVEWSFGAPQTMALGVGSGDATFNRLTSCSQLSPTATATRFDTIAITNNGPRAGILDVRTQPMAGTGTTVCPAGTDTVMAVYAGAFNPAAPLTGCLAFNDNVDGTTLCSRISSINVAAGATVTVVVSGFANADAFPYDVRFDGSVYGRSIFLASFEPSERFIGRGLPLTGEFRVDNYPAPFAAGSRLNGDVERETGAIQGRLAPAPAQLQDIATGLGAVTLRLQLWENGAGGGQIAGNGTATFGASDLFLRLQHVTVNGNVVSVGGDCQFGPITWALAGNSDANSIDMTQNPYVIPPVSATACNNFGTQLNSVFAGSDGSGGNTVTLSLAR